MTFKERQALNALSKEVYGTTSAWQKKLKGAAKPAKDELGNTILPVKVGRKDKYIKHTQYRWETVASVKATMLEIKAINEKNRQVQSADPAA